MKLQIAVIGGTGLVGGTIVDELQKSDLPIGRIRVLASGRSAGKKIGDITVEELTEDAFSTQDDIAFFAAGGAVSAKYARILRDLGILCIDNSSHFRNVPEIPLVVPNVNGHLLKGYKGIIANPNCSTIQCMEALDVIRKHFGLKKVIYSTYQATSGAGMKGLRDLQEGTHEAFDMPIVNNVIPRIDSFLDSGYTKEEMKMVNETRKILNLPDLSVVATCVRVPVDMGHSVSIYAQCEEKPDLDVIKKAIADVSGLVVKDDPNKLSYPTPLDVKGNDSVVCGRFRLDPDDNAILFWCVADNVRKGAATNTVDILREYLRINEGELNELLQHKE